MAGVDKDCSSSIYEKQQPLSDGERSRWRFALLGFVGLAFLNFLFLAVSGTSPQQSDVYLFSRDIVSPALILLGIMSAFFWCVESFIEIVFLVPLGGGSWSRSLCLGCLALGALDVALIYPVIYLVWSGVLPGGEMAPILFVTIFMWPGLLALGVFFGLVWLFEAQREASRVTMGKPS